MPRGGSPPQGHPIQTILMIALLLLIVTGTLLLCRDEAAEILAWVISRFTR